MIRCLPSLTMLAAHMFGMWVPTCFIQCVGPDGHACIQRVGEQCRCCEDAAETQCPSCSDDKDCCDQHHEPEVANAGPDSAGEQSNCPTYVSSAPCGCKHSPFDVSPAAVSATA